MLQKHETFFSGFVTGGSFLYGTWKIQPKDLGMFIDERYSTKLHFNKKLQMASVGVLALGAVAAGCHAWLSCQETEDDGLSGDDSDLFDTGNTFE